MRKRLYNHGITIIRVRMLTFLAIACMAIPPASNAQSNAPRRGLLGIATTNPDHEFFQASGLGTSTT